MKIKEVLATLRIANPEAKVYYGFGYLFPTTVNSWRGIYAEPALGWSESHGIVRTPPTVAALIAEIENAIDGREFTGYKGGEFSYTEDSTLHIDNYSEYSSTEIYRIEVNDSRVVIHTT